MNSLPAERKPNAAEFLGRKRRELFLKVLARTGRVVEASNAVGYANPTPLYRARQNDPDFAEDWDLALQVSAEILEAAAWDRAVNGTVKPVFFKGAVVGEELVYSDALLIELLRSRKKEFRRENQTKVDVNVDVNTKIGIAMIPMRATDEKDWERQALDVHEQQRSLPAFVSTNTADTDTEVPSPAPVQQPVSEKPKETGPFSQPSLERA